MYSNTCTQTLKHTHIYVNVTYNMHMFTPQCFELPSEQRATYSLSLSLSLETLLHLITENKISTSAKIKRVFVQLIVSMIRFCVYQTNPM